MRKTLIIFKPDCMEKRLVGEVMRRFEEDGFNVVGCKLLRLTPELLREHYSHVVDKPFYPRLEKFMSSRPVLVMAMQGQNIIQHTRELIGPTDSTKAPKGTIRGDYGTDVTINIVHASDSDEAAAEEIARFFRPDELFA